MVKKSIKVVKCQECGNTNSMECIGRMGSRKISCKCPVCGNKILI